MSIMFQRQDSLNQNNYNIWNAYFFFDIPFKAGYYEITEFQKYSIYGQTNSDSYKWEAIKPEDSKLIKRNF